MSRLIAKALFASAAMLVASPACAAEDAITAVKANCEREWGENYRMQKYCREKQFESMREYLSIIEILKSDETRLKIMHKCESDWIDGNTLNWRMVVYCYRKQNEAYESLNR